MFYENKVTSVDETAMLEIWVSYFGMNLCVEVPEDKIKNGKFYVATDKGGHIHMGSDAPCVLKDHSFWSGFNGFFNHITHTSNLPVCWRDSLVEYKL